MLTDRESRVVGPLVVAFGTAFFAAGLARILWPAADQMIYLASLGIGFGFPLLAAGLWSIRADMQRLGADLYEQYARAELVRAEADVRRAAVAPVAAEPDDAPDPEPVYTDDAIYRQQRAIDQRAAHWGEFWRRLGHAGDAYGWTQEALTTKDSPTRVMSEPAWNYAIPLMVWAGWLTGGKAGTRWAKGRSLALFESERGWELLPCSTEEPPEIAPPPYTRNSNTEQQQRNTPARVVDGLRAD